MSSARFQLLLGLPICVLLTIICNTEEFTHFEAILVIFDILFCFEMPFCRQFKLHYLYYLCVFLVLLLHGQFHFLIFSHFTNISNMMSVSRF